MKKLFFVSCCCLPLISFCQNKGLLDSINTIIGPQYSVSIDSEPSYHLYNAVIEKDLTGDGVKEIIVASSNVDTASELNKIFILARKRAGGFVIIDSSDAYFVDGSGPYIDIKGSAMVVTHNFPRGRNSITYEFTKGIDKYFMSKLSYSDIEPNNPDYDHGVSITQVFDLKTKVLTIKTSLRSNATEKIVKQKTKELNQKLPQGTHLSLANMDDPYNYDVFITEGELYRQMMTY
jgi:hypothetical protein